jgi:hypothetical protein
MPRVLFVHGASGSCRTAAERFNPGTSVEVVDFGPRHNQTGHVIDTDSDSVLVRFADGKDESFQANELGVNGPLPSAEPLPEAGESGPIAVGDTVRIAGMHLRCGDLATVIGLEPKGLAEVRIHGHTPRNGDAYPAYPLSDLERVVPTEESKPEPQPDAPLPLPWRLEFDGTLWSVMSADDQHVADDLREADARRIVERCGQEEPQPSGEDEHAHHLPWHVVNGPRVYDSFGGLVATFSTLADAELAVSRCNAPEPSASVARSEVEALIKKWRAVHWSLRTAEPLRDAADELEALLAKGAP